MVTLVMITDANRFHMSDKKRASADVGDIVSIHEDDVECEGPGYANAKVLKIKGCTTEEFLAWIGKKGAGLLAKETSKYFINLSTAVDTEINQLRKTKL